jgi:MFS family permease
MNNIDTVPKRNHSLLAPNPVLAVLCLMYLVLYVDRVNIATIAPRITADLRLTNTQFGFAISAFAYPYAILQLAGGWLSDRFQVRYVLAACGLVVCIATLLTGASTTFAMLVFARTLLGLGEGLAFPTATRALAIWLPPERWGFAQGITHAAARLGNALTPPLIAALLAYQSWHVSLYLLGLLSLLWTLAWLWATPKQERNSQVAGNEKEKVVVPWLKLAKRMLPVTAVDFCYGWTLWVFLTWLPLFFFQHFGLDLKHSALFSSGVLLAGVLGDTVGGVLTDRIYRITGSLQKARRNIIVFGMLGTFIFLLPVLSSRNVTHVALYLSAACFFSELIVAPIWAIPMDIAPRYAGTASGMMNFGFGVAGIISPAVFGKILDSTGSWAACFYVSLAILLLGAFGAFFMRPDRPFETAEVAG